jgi:hypothetical protein
MKELATNFNISKFTRSVKGVIGYSTDENWMYLHRWNLSIDLTDQRLSWESSMSQDRQEIYSHFVEPQISLPLSNKPTNCPQAEPYELGPKHSILHR